MGHRIDHFVYIVPDLTKAMKELDSRIGITCNYGGKHPDKGTHNAIFGLGISTYFEILAPDPERDININPSWLGTNYPEENRISHWCIATEDLEKDVEFLNKQSKYPYSIIKGSRKTSEGKLLTWELGICKENRKTDVFPFLINWGETPHPSSNLRHECSIKNLNLQHPCPQKIQNILEYFVIDATIEKSEKAGITLFIDTPNGELHFK